MQKKQIDSKGEWYVSLHSNPVVRTMQMTNRLFSYTWPVKLQQLYADLAGYKDMENAAISVKGCRSLVSK